MLVSDTFVVQADQQKVWDFFANPVQLASCIPGCSSIEPIDEKTYKAALSVTVAFMTLHFQIQSTVETMEPPNRLVSVGTGQPRGLPGVLRMKIELILRPVEGGTEVRYEMDVGMSGRLGAIGQTAFQAKAAQVGKEFAANVQNALA